MSTQESHRRDGAAISSQNGGGWWANGDLEVLRNRYFARKVSQVVLGRIADGCLHAARLYLIQYACVFVYGEGGQR